MEARSIIILLLAGALSGCTSNSTQQTNDPNKGDADIDFREYFPMKVGSRWVYDLKLGEEALEQQWELVWPTRDGRQCGRTIYASYKRPNSTSTLTLEVKQVMTPSKAFGGESFTSGALIERTTDTLPIYSYTELETNETVREFQPHQMMWGLREQPFEVEEIVFFDTAKRPQDADPMAAGRQDRCVFFNPRELEKVNALNGSDISLTSMGIDKDVPGYEGQSCLRLARFYGNLDNLRFTEELWYAKDKGLVRKVQKVGDKVTLTQTLREYVPGK